MLALPKKWTSADPKNPSRLQREQHVDTPALKQGFLIQIVQSSIEGSSDPSSQKIEKIDFPKCVQKICPTLEVPISKNSYPIQVSLQFWAFQTKCFINQLLYRRGRG